MFSGASNFVEGVDNAFVFILAIAFFFLIGITLVMIYFLWRYNAKKNPKATQIEGSVKLEIIWTVIPILLVLGMFYYGYVGWIPMKRPPDDARTIRVNARMWNFSFQYENGRVTDTLYLPVDEPVILELRALDVMHSLYIPAFRVKEDMVPGLANNRMWFIPTKVGRYNLFCTEYCGLQHSYMYTDVVVMSQPDFEEWYTDTAYAVAAVEEGVNPAILGRRIVESKGCVACHSLDGSKLVGPSFKGIWEKPVTVITKGQERELIVDEDYIRRSIYEPDADVVKGYRGGQMLSYKDEISEEQLSNIVEFIKSLK